MYVVCIKWSEYNSVLMSIIFISSHMLSIANAMLYMYFIMSHMIITSYSSPTWFIHNLSYAKLGVRWMPIGEGRLSIEVLDEQERDINCNTNCMLSAPWDAGGPSLSRPTSAMHVGRGLEGDRGLSLQYRLACLLGMSAMESDRERSCLMGDVSNPSDVTGRPQSYTP